MESYKNLLRDVLDNHEPHDDRTGVGTLSVFGRQWRHNMNHGFPLLTTKKVPLRWVFEELRWFLSGSTYEQDLRETGVDIWKEWATKDQCARFGREEGDLGHVYGGLWRDFLADGSDDLGNDQIAALLHDLKNSPNSRRLIVSGWHPVEQRNVALPPCHTLWQLKVHSPRPGDSWERLSLHLYARSIDIFLGLPFNIASYGLLLEMLAHVTNRKPEDLIISFGDLHLYKNHVEQALEQLSRDCRLLPGLAISESLRGGGLDALLAMRWEDIDLINYDPHPPIKADVAV